MRHHTVAPIMLAGAALALVACGSDGSSAQGAEGNAIDRAFVAEMIPHHESALNMAEIAQERAESRFVRDLADAIVRTQTAEIATMRAEDRKLASAGIGTGELGMSMTEMGTEMSPGMLQDADEFDEEFLRMMVPHHEGAVRMARMELEKGSDPELETLARGIVDAQETEIS